MIINVVQGNIAQRDDPAVVVNLFEGVTQPGGATGALDRALDGAITDLIGEGDVTGKKGELTLIYSLGRIPSRRVVVAGLGKSEAFDTCVAREVHADTARFLRSKGVASYATILHGAGIAGLEIHESALAAAEGIVLGLYTFDKYKADSDSGEIESVNIVEFDESKLDPAGSAVERGCAIADAVNLARDMANEPANYMTPTRMAEIALEVASDCEMSLTVLERGDIESLGMGAFAGVAQGTEEPPKFIIMKYDGDRQQPRQQPRPPRQGHNLRQRRPRHKVRIWDAYDEGRYVRRRLRHCRNAGYRPAEAPHQRVGNRRRDREHARTARPATRRRRPRHGRYHD